MLLHFVSFILSFSQWLPPVRHQSAQIVLTNPLENHFIDFLSTSQSYYTNVSVLYHEMTGHQISIATYVVIIFIPHVTLTHLDELVVFFVQIQFQQSFQNWKIITNSITREGSLQQRDNVLYQKSYQRWFYKILMILK